MHALSGANFLLIRTLLLILFILSGSLSKAETRLTDINALYKITQDAEYLFDASGLWTFEDAKKQSQWQPINKARINFSFIDEPVWLRFAMKSDIDATWIMHIGYPLLDYLDVYILNDDQILNEYHTGDLRSFSTRPVNHPNFVFPILMDSETPLTVYLRVDTRGAAEVPIWFEEESKFDSDNQTREFIRGWVNGILAIMLFYNLFIFLFIKERVYIFYVLNVAVYLVQLSIYDGSGFQYFWGDTPEANKYAFPFFNGLMQLTQFLFLVTFLDVLSRNQWYVKPVKVVLAILTTLPILGLILDYRVIVPVQVLFALIVNGFGLIFGLYFSWKGETSAKYFTVAWSVFLIGLFITNLKSLGIIPNNAFVQYSYQIGAFIEMAILSLALAQRIEHAQKSLINLQTQHINTLENYQNLYNNSLSGQFQSNQDGYFLSVNPAFKKMFDSSKVWNLEEDISLNVKDLMVNQDDLQDINRTLKNRGSLLDYEVQLKDSQNLIRWYSVSVRPNLSQDNDQVRYEGSIVDINERKENEALREQALVDRMATLEQLAIGICHEINTPLGISITGATHIEGLLNEISELVDSEKLTKSKLLNVLDQEKESVELIDHGLNRVSELIKQFKQVSVSQLGFEIENTDMALLLEELRHIDEVKEHAITLDIKLNDTFEFNGYGKACVLVLSELISNSLLHSFSNKEDGTVSIRCGLENDDVVIHYWDDGEGIDVNNRQELFNAFYTTKRGSHGRIGLGLYQVFNLVSQLLRGRIELLDESHIHYVIRFPKSINTN